MANKFFNIKHGIKVGNFEVDANDGSVTTSGNITLTGNAVLSTTAGANITVGNVVAESISLGDSSLSITDSGSGANIRIIIDGTTEHTVDADGVNLASGDRYAIAGTSVLNATTLGSGVVNSSLTSVGTLGSLAVTGNASAGNISTGGVLSVTGNANVGNIGATNGVFTNVSGNGSALTALPAGNLTGTIPSGVQGNITQTGTLTALTVTGTATAGNLSTGGTLNVTGNANVGNLGTAGLITATGNVTGGNLVTAGTVKTPSVTNGTSNVGIVLDGNVSVGVNGTAGVLVVTSTGANIAGTANVTGNLTAGNVNTSGVFSVTGNANVGNLGTGGQITSTGNITGGNIIATNGVYGDGSGLTNLTAGNLAGTIPSSVLGNSTVYIGSTGVALNRSTAALSLTGVSIDGSAATVSGAAQGNITSVGTLTSLTVTGNVAGGNLTTAGAVAATGNVTGGNLVTGGVLSVTGNANVGNIGAAAGVFTGAVNATGNITGGNLVTGGVLSATGNVSGGNLTTAGVVSATGNVSGGNLTTAGQIKSTAATAATSTTSGAIVSGGGLGVAGNLHVGGTAHNIAGNLTVGNLTVSGTTYTVNSNNVSYVDSILELHNTSDSSPLTTDDGKDVGIRVHYYKGSDKHAFFGWANDSSSFEFYSDGTETAGVFSGTYGVMKGAQFNSTATTGTAPFIVNSTTTVANLAAATATSATTAGTVTNAAQGNITSVGTLTSLTVSGNISAGNVSATTFTGALSGAATTAGTVTTAAQGNITSVGTLTGLSVNGTVTAVNVTANTGVFTGNASGLTAIPGANITGTISSGVVPTLNQNTTGYAATVSGAAQGNITSVGTLTSLTVTGNISGGNISTGGVLSVTGNANVGNIGAAAGVFTTVTGSAAGMTSIPAGNLSGTIPTGVLGNSTHYIGTTAIALNRGSAAQSLTGITSIDGYAATVSGASQGNITSVGTLTSLTTSGTIAPNANGTIDIGTTTARFNNVYGVTFIGVSNTAKYADLAEKYTADADYEPGTVLEFGGDAEVTVSTTDASSKVAGVVTTDPAYLMNSHLESAHTAAVALQGRVPCKVIGPVAKGDMMVSAGNGRARAEADPKIGSVIGKALEAHADGEGVIEVVVGRV